MLYLVRNKGSIATVITHHACIGMSLNGDGYTLLLYYVLFVQTNELCMTAKDAFYHVTFQRGRNRH